MYPFTLLLLSIVNIVFTSDASNHTSSRYAHLEHEPCTRKCSGYSSNEDRALETSHFCRCDSLCQRFGDCCQNFPRTISVLLYEWPKFECRQVTYGGVYEIKSCPLYWTGPENIRLKCETSNRHDVRDPLSSVPLSNLDSTLTYKNFHCAVCNGETLENLVFWNVHLGIPGLTRYNLSYGNVSLDYAKDALTFNAKTGKWGLSLWVAKKHSSVFFDAYIWFDINEDLYRKTRSCIPRIIDKCKDDWTDERQAKLCEEFLDPHHLLSSRVSKIFRNLHCALCNGEKSDALTCFKSKRGTSRRGADFAMMYDINALNPRSGRNKMQNGKCDYAQVYDPFSKTCRSLLDSDEDF